MTPDNDAMRALELYQNPRYMVRYDKMRDDHRYEIFRYGEDDEPEIVIYARYDNEGDADHAQDEANLDDLRTALQRSAQVDEKVVNAVEYFQRQPWDPADGHDCQLRALLNFVRERMS